MIKHLCGVYEALILIPVLPKKPETNKTHKLLLYTHSTCFSCWPDVHLTYIIYWLVDQVSPRSLHLP